MDREHTMKVVRIVPEGDRTLLYGTDPHYHVIAKPNEDVKVGDEIIYEPYGGNFGWYKGKKS